MITEKQYIASNATFLFTYELIMQVEMLKPSRNSNCSEMASRPSSMLFVELRQFGWSVGTTTDEQC